MSWILPVWAFSALIWGAIILAVVAGGGLLVLFTADIRNGSLW